MRARLALVVCTFVDMNYNLQEAAGMGTVVVVMRGSSRRRLTWHCILC